MHRNWIVTASCGALLFGGILLAQQPLSTKSGSTTKSTTRPATTAPSTTGPTTTSGSKPSSGTTTKSPATTAANTSSNGTARSTLPPKNVQPGKPAGGLTKEQTLAASYAIGLDIAMRFKSEESLVDPESLLRGIKDGFSEGKPMFSEDVMKTAIMAFDQEMRVRGEAQFKLMAENNLKEGAAFLATNKSKKGIKALPSGLQYEIVKSGTGKTPKLTDKIKAHYHGTFINGSVFDSSVQADQPLEIPMQDVIPGWTEALQMMKVGDKWKLYVPPALAYGDQGFAPAVPPNAVLIFELELLDIVK